MAEGLQLQQLEQLCAALYNAQASSHDDVHLIHLTHLGSLNARCESMVSACTKTYA